MLNGAGGTRWPAAALPSPPPAATPDAGSTQAVEVEAEGSVVRSYPTGARGREMSGDDHRRAISEGLGKALTCRARQSTQKQLLSWGSAHCSGVCMISPLRTTDACGDRATTQT